MGWPRLLTGPAMHLVIRRAPDHHALLSVPDRATGCATGVALAGGFNALAQGSATQ